MALTPDVDPLVEVRFRHDGLFNGKFWKCMLRHCTMERHHVIIRFSGNIFSDSLRLYVSSEFSHTKYTNIKGYLPPYALISVLSTSLKYTYICICVKDF